MSGRALLLVLAVALAGCAADSPYVPPPFTGEPTPLKPPEEAWTRLLKAGVDDNGRVDFAAVLADHADLDRYVAWIYERSPESWPDFYRTRAHVIAYHLNAYNALSMYNLLTSGVPESLSMMDRRTFFERRKMFVGGQLYSLQAYRDEVIRPLGEPRMHFALTSLLGGDPRLSREPYRASTLDSQLDRAARNFFAEPRNLKVDDARRTIVLSPLMKAYQKDFLKAASSLPAYINRFRDTPLPEGYAVEFGEPDWSVFRKPMEH